MTEQPTIEELQAHVARLGEVAWQVEMAIARERERSRGRLFESLAGIVRLRNAGCSNYHESGADVARQKQEESDGTS